ncbi:MAG: DEAD/DEAH box helicase [Acidobacteriia bacterium]|nr:DEAD/DEAH box helicase [Terriglobia bacterium]
MESKADALASFRPHDLAPVQSALKEIEEKFRAPRTQGGVTAIRHFPAREPRVEPFPASLPPRVMEILKARGFACLYTHQAAAFTLAREGKNLVVVTPTASGKTLCYNLPILSELVENPEARALYLFPTKALSQDQLVELNRWTEQLGDQVRTFTYDGDTPQDARKAIRARGNLVITNPDMLHTGILPHHTKWQRLFENLRYVVIDELHYYRGVLGSHLANVLRRLKRVARFYGSQPQFICTSATIANPQELAARILEEDVELVDDNGAPSAEKYFVFYNPPVVNPQLGIRRSYLNETRRLARTFLSRGLQTIVFANSRLATEILVTYLKEDFSQALIGPEAVRGYRGGYLPLERREIERDLRNGLLRGVVATNALELGIDIGSLDVALLAAYPGTIASTWQRAGRTGRRQGTSAAVLIASSAPLDQFMVQNPEYFFGRSPEHGYVNPDNLLILLNHLKCAAFELPLGEDEKFGSLDLRRLCEHLEETGFLHHTTDGWHWLSESYPADAISLRSVSSDNFVIVDNTSEPRVIGETDFSSALTTLHEKAIYIQNGVQYHVERLDYDDRKAYVHQVDSEYFTDAISYTKIKILETFDSAPAGPAPAEGPTADGGAASQLRPAGGSARSNHGEVQVNTQVVGFKKIKFHTMENVGSGELTLPEQEMHTTAFWLTLPRSLMDELPYNSTERLDGVNGLANALGAIATLLVMCDARDLGTSVGENAELEISEPSVDSRFRGNDDEVSRGDAARRPYVTTAVAKGDGVHISEPFSERPGRRTVVRKIFEPNIYLYDRYPGGVGLSEPLFRMSDSLLEKTRELIADCPCPSGCPSCVGPVGEIGEKGKEVALEILRRMVTGT